MPDSPPFFCWKACLNENETNPFHESAFTRFCIEHPWRPLLFSSIFSEDYLLLLWSAADPKNPHGAVIGTHVRPYPLCCKFTLDHLHFQEIRGHTFGEAVITCFIEVALQSAD